MTAIDLAPHNPYGLALRRPVLAAAGCFGYGVEYARQVDIEGIGAIVTRSTSLRGRRVARPPQLIETPAGLLCAGAWPDPGLERVIAQYAPVWAGWSTPVLLSLVGETPEDYAACAAALEGVEGISGLELNLAEHASRAAQITAAVRAATQLPLLAKLGPAPELAALARAVAGAGADALTLSGSPRGQALDPASGQPIAGWLAGPALRPLALALLVEVAAAVDLPLLGCGGITSADDARQFLAAGALAVQLGSILLVDPGALVQVGAELEAGA